MLSKRKCVYLTVIFCIYLSLNLLGRNIDNHEFAEFSTPVFISNDFKHTEGPIWDKNEEVFYFSDIENNKIYSLSLPDKINIFLDQCNNPNGMAFDNSGNILVAQHGTRSVSIINESKKIEILINDYEEKSFNSPNDLIVKSDGSIYFTDPEFGLKKGKKEINFMGVYRYTQNYELFVEAEYYDAPNGILFSPDESKLYLTRTFGNEITVFDVLSDGSLFNPQIFAQINHPDGMAIDIAGNIYATGLEGIYLFNSQGDLLNIFILDSQPTNCCFGGLEGKILLITARNNLYYLNVSISGF